MGWIYESIFCTIKAGKWENRGFLFGPLCPIYGAGGVAITAIADAFYAHGHDFLWWQVFIISFFGSIVLEYSTSWILEKLFHAYWWDYSDMPLNIQGRVCLLYSIGFGVGGLLVVYGIAPFTRNITEWMSPVELELFSLIFMGMISVDTTLTVSALTHFERTVFAMQDALNNHMDALVNNVQEKRVAFELDSIDEKIRFSKENLEQRLRAMGGASRSAVRRVKGYRSKKVEKVNMDLSFDSIKSFMKRK